jgi:hypothetical protein
MSIPNVMARWRLALKRELPRDGPVQILRPMPARRRPFPTCLRLVRNLERDFFNVGFCCLAMAAFRK